MCFLSNYQPEIKLLISVSRWSPFIGDTSNLVIVRYIDPILWIFPNKSKLIQIFNKRKNVLFLLFLSDLYYRIIDGWLVDTLGFNKMEFRFRFGTTDNTVTITVVFIVVVVDIEIIKGKIVC